ncbi:MAG: ComF family protein, partial [Gammaproteobacteria bacterium]
AMDWVNKCLKYAQMLGLPRVCALCGASPARAGYGLCAACLDELPFLGRVCGRCASPLGSGEICGKCQVRPPPYECLSAVFQYAEPVSSLIQGLKFHGRLSYARLLGELMASHLETALFTAPRLLLPVPLHRRRLRERGYNQALELARPIARQLGIPLDYRWCRRVMPTAMQSQLSVKARRGNVRNAFQVTPRPGFEHVAVIDDVLTTGHTVVELVRCLKAAGAERVDVWVCARALLHGYWDGRSTVVDSAP